MAHTYALYPWSWNSLDLCHEPPLGAFAVLDLRPEPEQARQGQSSGWGFFAWPDTIPGNGPNVAPPSDIISLGYGDCRELQPSTATRDELRLKLGLSSNPAGTTLIDCVSDILGSLSDPTGQNGPKPLLPTREGSLEIHLATHSRVWGQVFDANPMLSTLATGKHNRIREVIRTDLETANKNGGAVLVSKVLGGLLDRWGVDYSQSVKWRNLLRGPLLAELLANGGGRFNPRKPQTSYSDAFTRADSATLGASWTQFLVGTNTMEVVSNACAIKRSSTGGSTAFFSSRYDSDVSSSDHWCQAAFTATTLTSSNLRGGPLARFDSSAQTAYWAYCEANDASNGLDTFKVVAGATTSLATQSPTNAKSKPWTAKIDCSGSTISSYENGTQRSVVTDTSITGNLRGGLGGIMLTAGNTLTFDDWSVDDGITAGGSIYGMLLMGCGT